MAAKHFTIYFTSDLHGYIYPTDYRSREERDIGLFKCASQFQKDGNTLIIDGGDTIQGSPLTNLYQRLSPEEKAVSMRSSWKTIRIRRK